jgi:hypothetical protein
LVGDLIAKAALILALGVWQPTWDTRITAHYRPGLMEGVVEYRRERGWDIPLSNCYLAHPTLPIGEWVQVKGLNTGKTLMCVGADTSQDEDRERHIKAKLVEVGFDEAKILCGSTRLRNDECPTLIRRMW